MRTLRNAGQFAYLRGVSTDAALHQLVSRIERSLKSAEFCLGIFLDIEGAFSHATFKSMDEAMGSFHNQHGLPPMGEKHADEQDGYHRNTKHTSESSGRTGMPTGRSTFSNSVESCSSRTTLHSEI